MTIIGSAPGAAGADGLAAGVDGGLAPDGRAGPLTAAGWLGPCNVRDGVEPGCEMFAVGSVEVGVGCAWEWV